MVRRIEVRACSITETGAAVVVNASNDTARLGGGVSRALFNECGGPALQAEMNQKLEDDFDGVLDEGDCLITSAGTSTKIRHLLHVPAVDYSGTRARLGASGVERSVTSPARIQASTEAALRAAADIAKEEGTVVSIAFPLLGAGAGGVPVVAVCHSMIAGLRDFFAESPEAGIDLVVFAVPEPDRFEVCSRLVKAAFAENLQRVVRETQ
jgi:O-acetyl-ADP-ribose deacetylase (regulator of RNase III)